MFRALICPSSGVSSTITMMHGPINIRKMLKFCLTMATAMGRAFAERAAEL